MSKTASYYLSQLLATFWVKKYLAKYVGVFSEVSLYLFHTIFLKEKRYF